MHSLGNMCLMSLPAGIESSRRMRSRSMQEMYVLTGPGLTYRLCTYW